MGSIGETEKPDILDSKPYITKSELSVVIDKHGRNLDKKVLSLTKKGDLIILKKGLYVSKNFAGNKPKNYVEFIANFLYYPSYLSLEYVLQKEGLMPDAPYAYTSVALKATRVFSNSFGRFQYRNIKEVLFCGYVLEPFWDMYKVKMATKAKALFDFLYLHKFVSAIETELTFDLRINWDNFSLKDLDEFLKYVRLSNSSKMRKIYLVIKEILYDTRKS